MKKHTRYKTKKDFVIPYVRGKKVLDLGCVDHSLSRTQHPDWLHGLIHKETQSVIGVDYLEHEVCVLNDKGFNIVCTNVETMDFGERFDVIVAGDIIEHLSNPGRFLEKVHLHLTENGVCLLTTPSPVNFLRLVELLFVGYVDAHPEHTSWYTPEVLKELAGKYGLAVVETAYVDDAYLYYDPKSWWRFFLFLDTVLCRVFPRFSETLCFILKKCES
jgi:2-polyprenyl-3-methyl-5-hydroxy-6-metoxy-1,4-benzoquinol methylase